MFIQGLTGLNESGLELNLVGLTPLLKVREAERGPRFYTEKMKTCIHFHHKQRVQGS